MRLITFRGNSDHDDDLDAYWRRRFFILGGGLAVLMLLAWLFGGGGASKQAAKTAAARAAAAARQARGSLPSAAYGTPYGAASASAAPWDSPGTPSASPSASPSPAGSASPSPSASAAAAAGKPGKGGQCAAGSIVLSLFTSQPAYGPRQQPTFNVYAVSTSASACRLKYGPAAVRVLVTKSGKVVWDSGACPAGRRGAQTVHLAPGVPQEVAVSWNRRAASRSCAGKLPRTGSGTFAVMAVADGHFSPVRTFKIVS